MENIIIINYSNGPFSFNSELYASVDKKDLKLSVVPRLRYSSNSDYVGFQLDITLTAGNTQVLKTGFLIGMIVRGWSDMLKSGVNLTTERQQLLNICQTGWYVATGIVAQETKASGTEEFILPPINAAKFTEEVLLMSSDSTHATTD